MPNLEQTYIVYLYPKSSYRTELRSDTLWGILCWGIKKLFGEQKLLNFLDQYIADNPEFILSSTFPFKTVGRDKYRFFPKPIPLSLFPNHKEEKEELDVNDYQLKKKFKKVSFLGEEEYFSFLQGAFDPTAFFEKYSKSLGNNPSQQAVYTVAPSKKVLTYTHNTIDRIKGSTLERDGAGQLYHTDELLWDDPTNESGNQFNVGLFFLVRGATELLTAVLRFLKHNGWGGDRTIGKGTFDFELEEYHFPKVEAANASTNLSLFFPRPHELADFTTLNEPFSYLLERRAGKVGGYRIRREKPPYLFFQEGSVFPLNPELTDQQDWGQTIEMKVPKIPHPIYHNGKGFMVKMRVI